MGQLSLEGALLAGPPGCGGTFPTTSTSTPIGFYTEPKGFTSCSGALSRTLNSPSSFVTLPALGASGDVVQADTLYLKSDGPVVLRMVQDDGSGVTTVTYDLPVSGLVILEFPAAQPLLGISVKGTARIEYLLSGPT